MQSGRGFTLIELMVVILIIAILAAVAIPVLQRQVSASKWTEGKSSMGTIATAIRAYCSGSLGSSSLPTNLWADQPNNLGFARSDLNGNYFDGNDFSFTVTSSLPLEYTITATNPDLHPPQYQLNQDGQWVSP